MKIMSKLFSFINYIELLCVRDLSGWCTNKQEITVTWQIRNEKKIWCAEIDVLN